MAQITEVQNLLKSAFFMYKSKDDANNGKQSGGTGFFVCCKGLDGKAYKYAVTNRHIVEKSFLVMRFIGLMVGFIPLKPIKRNGSFQVNTMLQWQR